VSIEDAVRTLVLVFPLLLRCLDEGLEVVHQVVPVEVFVE